MSRRKIYTKEELYEKHKQYTSFNGIVKKQVKLRENCNFYKGYLQKPEVQELLEKEKQIVSKMNNLIDEVKEIHKKKIDLILEIKNLNFSLKDTKNSILKKVSELKKKKK